MGQSTSRSRSEELRVPYSLMPSLLAIVVSVALGCQQHDPQWRAMVPGGKANLVAVLKSEITYQEIRRFQEEELIVGDFEKGHWHRPGIDVTMQLRVDGHEAFAVVFDPEATPEELDAIRAGLKRSPYVHRVFQDVNPWEIRLDAEPEYGEGIKDESRGRRQSG